jgi:3-oxoadipate enol-lactonase
MMVEKTEITATRAGFIEVEDGTRRIYWEYMGDGEKEVVVFLNGLAMLTKSWYRTVPFLYPDYDILLYDYFGQGGSSQEDEPYFISRFADFLVQVMDVVGIEKIHPIGVSYGGFVGAELGRLHQDRLHTLTLSGILLTRETLFQMYQDISLRFYHSTDEVFDIYTQYLYEKTFGENISRKIYGAAMDAGRYKFYERYKDKKYCLVRLTEAQNPFFENIDNDPNAYRDVRTPTLILIGEQDRAIPPWQQKKMVNILPNSKLIMLPECGHMTYMERPNIFWPTLKKFFTAKSVDFE